MLHLLVKILKATRENIQDNQLGSSQGSCSTQQLGKDSSSEGQEKLVIFLSPIQYTWVSVLPNRFSSRTGSSVRNALLVACICH